MKHGDPDEPGSVAALWRIREGSRVEPARAPLANCSGKGMHNLRCKYHGWLYDQEGRLIGAPETVAAMPAALLWVLKRFVPILREVDEMLYQNRQAYVFSSARFMQRYPDFRLTPYPEGLAAMVEAARETKRA